MTEWLDLVGAVLIAGGAFLCFTAAVSLVRFPDLLAKMHAVTKPQVLGLVLVSVGIALSLREAWVTGVCVLIVLLQLVTAPVSASMVARGAYRLGLMDTENLVLDDLARDLESAGFSLQPGHMDERDNPSEETQ